GGATPGSGGASGSAGVTSTAGGSSGTVDGGVAGGAATDASVGGADASSGIINGRDTGSCGCRIPARSSSNSGAFVSLALGALFLARRRRRNEHASRL
ncbi:MAG TPA: MYXO-CTERM sorting domain-containing protein, partial [Polyangiaceae bacterium]|nr:MYXO-CTERM sorting domain-containing protein [Polyangiaceae bacterium]